MSPNLKRALSLQDQNSLYWKSCVCIVSHLCSLDSLFLALLLTLLVQSRTVPPALSNCTDHKNRAEHIASTLFKEADDLQKSYVSTRLVIFLQAESVFLSYRLQSVTTLGLNVSVPCLHCECHSYWKILTALTALTFYTEHFLKQPITLKHESHPEYYYYYYYCFKIKVVISVCNAALHQNNWTQ